MKIAVILPRGMVFSSNGATSIDLVARDFLLHSRQLDETLVIAPQVEKPFEGINFIGLEASSQAGRQKEILSILREKDIRTVVVHQHPPTAFFLKKQLGSAKVVLYRHGLLKKRRSWISRLWRERQFAKLDHIVFVSHFLRAQFLEDYSSLEGASSVINNGVDTTFWRPDEGKEQEIVYLGRARADKGIVELVEAFRLAELHGWNLKLIAAVQTEAERQFADQIDQMIADDEAIALVRNLQSGEVRDALAGAAVAALPSIVREGFPRAVVEAMACGCATLATKSGGTPEAAGEAAILLDHASPEAIADALSGMIGQEGHVDALAARARAHILDQLDIKVVAHQLDALLDDLEL